jgi:hypothetical protein
MEKFKFIKDINPSNKDLIEDEIRMDIREFFSSFLKDYYNNPKIFIVKIDIRISYIKEGITKYKLITMSNKINEKDMDQLLTIFYLRCKQKEIKITSLKGIFLYV